MGGDARGMRRGTRLIYFAVRTALCTGKITHKIQIIYTNKAQYNITLAPHLYIPTLPLKGYIVQVHNPVHNPVQILSVALLPCLLFPPLLFSCYFSPPLPYFPQITTLIHSLYHSYFTLLLFITYLPLFFF